MKKAFLLAALFCMAVPSVNAQTEEPETKVEKMSRLTKEADANPADWKAQLEAGHFLLDKENGMYDLQQAGKYFERIYHLATDYNKEIPDSVFLEAGTTLLTAASDKQDLEKSMFYIDELLHAQKVGLDIKDDYKILFTFWGMLYSTIKEDFPRSLTYMSDFREKLTQNNTPGIEYTDVLTSVLFERLMEKFKDKFGDKLMEVTFDGQKYHIISMNDWNIEKPLMGWMAEMEDAPMLLYGEDGKVYDDVHGQLEYSFFFDQGGVKPQENANARLVTVTPEQRQQMVEAYHRYMKKAKKNKK